MRCCGSCGPASCARWRYWHLQTQVSRRESDVVAICPPTTSGSRRVARQISCNDPLDALGFELHRCAGGVEPGLSTVADLERRERDLHVVPLDLGVWTGDHVHQGARLRPDRHLRCGDVDRGDGPLDASELAAVAAARITAAVVPIIAVRLARDFRLELDYSTLGVELGLGPVAELERVQRDVLVVPLDLGVRADGHVHEIARLRLDRYRGRGEVDRGDDPLHFRLGIHVGYSVVAATTVVVVESTSAGDAVIPGPSVAVVVPVLPADPVVAIFTE